MCFSHSHRALMSRRHQNHLSDLQPAPFNIQLQEQGRLIANLNKLVIFRLPSIQPSTQKTQATSRGNQNQTPLTFRTHLPCVRFTSTMLPFTHFFLAFLAPLLVLLPLSSAWSMSFSSGENCDENNASYSGSDRGDCLTAGNPGDNCKWYTNNGGGKQTPTNTSHSLYVIILED